MCLFFFSIFLAFFQYFFNIFSTFFQYFFNIFSIFAYWLTWFIGKLIGDINAIDNEISENEKKEKDILANLEKNNAILSEMDSLIIILTNKINKTNESSNK